MLKIENRLSLPCFNLKFITLTMKNLKWNSHCLLIFSFIAVFTSCALYPDYLKRKAAIFFIGNMDAHILYVSKSWDDLKVEVDTFYRKENRPSELINGFNALYDKYDNGLQDITYVSDLQTASVQFLISHIGQVFHVWKSPYADYLNFANSGEYIFSYRVQDYNVHTLSIITMNSKTIIETV